MCGGEEPGILLEKHEQVVSKLKNNKAPG